MFTGIVQAVGTVVRVTPSEAGARIEIDPDARKVWAYAPPAGDSIAVSGVCLTHAPHGAEPRPLVFDVIAETLRRTTLGKLVVGARVNLEASLTASTPIAGHFVQGHVDAIGRVVEVRSDPADYRVTVEVPAEAMRHVIPKGSVAIDGVSLTVADADAAARRFTVALIPTTLRGTTLGERRVGDAVNIETDMLVRAALWSLREFGRG